jgi:hypothetical protein
MAAGFVGVAAVATGTATAAKPEWFECAQVEGTGEWKNAACSESASKNGNYERVSLSVANYAATSGEVKLETAKDLITCKKSGSSGYIEGANAAKEVKTKLTGCKGEERTGKKTCAVSSTKPKGGTEEIVFNTLDGELGKVAKSEATSEVGLLLSPESGPDAEVEGSCLSPKSTAIEGGLIAEVTPVGKTSTTSDLHYVISEKNRRSVNSKAGRKMFSRHSAKVKPRLARLTK